MAPPPRSGGGGPPKAVEGVEVCAISQLSSAAERCSSSARGRGPRWLSARDITKIVQNAVPYFFSEGVWHLLGPLPSNRTLTRPMLAGDDSIGGALYVATMARRSTKKLPTFRSDRQAEHFVD